jgi:ApaG protein
LTKTEIRTPEIRVDVETAFVPEQSDAESRRYVFAYTITIRHLGGAAARLLNRHWIITDGNGGQREVRGPGVVGEHPHLSSGEQYRYSSGSILETQIGSMQGSYEFIDDAGVTFEVPIPAFTLAVPNVLH